METRWVTVDGVHLQIPEDSTVDQLRDALHKPSDAVLVGVTGDLVAVVHDDNRPLSDLIAGCADTYYFRRPEEPRRNDVLASSRLERALADPADEETTFERPGIDH